MCGHIWKEVNDVRICLCCGMTVSMIDGAILFDRKLANIKDRKGRKADEK